MGAAQNRRLSVGAPEGSVRLLPVERFAEPGGSESDHTARFYQGVKSRNEISVRQAGVESLGPKAFKL